MFRRLISRFVGFCIPELKPILNKRLSLHTYEDIEIDIDKNNFSKLYRPYRLIDSSIDKGTYISINSKVSRTSIGKFCSVGPNFVCGWGIHPTDGISTSPYFYSTLKQNGGSIAKQNLINEHKRITIGNDVFIGANVTVLDGVSIGDGVIIGAGSVVSKDIPDYAIAYGNPIEIKRFRFAENRRKQLKKIAWWNFKDEDLKDINTMFFDIESFIEKYDK